MVTFLTMQYTTNCCDFGLIKSNLFKTRDFYWNIFLHVRGSDNKDPYISSLHSMSSLCVMIKIVVLMETSGTNKLIDLLQVSFFSLI